MIRNYDSDDLNECTELNDEDIFNNALTSLEDLERNSMEDFNDLETRLWQMTKLT